MKLMNGTSHVNVTCMSKVRHEKCQAARAMACDFFFSLSSNQETNQFIMFFFSQTSFSGQFTLFFLLFFLFDPRVLFFLNRLDIQDSLFFDWYIRFSGYRP